MKHKFLVFAFVVQFVLIVLVFLNAYLPLLLGDELRVRARGYDPRDILSGNFVRLDYGIRVKEDELPQDRQIKEFFVLLVDENNDEVFEFGKILLDEPQNELYIKAKRSHRWSDLLEIGAEKYFVPKEKALEIERKLRSLSGDAFDGNGRFGALVTLKIYKGKARIVDLKIIEDAKSDLQGKDNDELEPLTGGLDTVIN
ncbi:GDYXXLXY domain-containing protein [Campylobacter troglodytis]|uniref:GDYXXLXY domain-containing protein n=1 Tax=Campylobacter troglodytis TaxID=654363 RepID=UPI001157A645|nr:GDYXXLXY domain-containing protein [Campylobacter troglodytis]TQR53085.1 hypothetical protein DMC01_12100 [Campylobacter troglodytis]